MITVDHETFRRLRELSGYSIKKVASVLKIDANDLQEYENGNKEMKFTMPALRKLARLYKRSVDTFFLPADVFEDISKFMIYEVKDDEESHEPIASSINLDEDSPELRHCLLKFREARYYQHLLDLPDEVAEKAVVVKYKGKVYLVTYFGNSRRRQGHD